MQLKSKVAAGSMKVKAVYTHGLLLTTQKLMLHPKRKNTTNVRHGALSDTKKEAKLNGVKLKP